MNKATTTSVASACGSPGLQQTNARHPFISSGTGPIRGIPFGWSLVDMSFGVFGVLPLIPVWRYIKVLESGGPAHTPPGVPAPAAQPPLDGYPRPAI